MCLVFNWSRQMFYYSTHVVCTFLVCETPAPVPDPFDDADALGDLEEEIVVLAAHSHASAHRVLTLVAEFDRRRGCKGERRYVWIKLRKT
jgi:hypothetical protein